MSKKLPEITYDEWTSALSEAMRVPDPPKGALTIDQLCQKYGKGATTMRVLMRKCLGKTVEKGKFGSAVYYWPKKK